MTQTVRLGEIACPSGELILMDGGYLGLWSGSQSPEEVRPPDAPPAVDFEVVGPDAEAAARSFDRQSGRTVYDIPVDGAMGFVESFDELCREQRYEAQLRPYEKQVPHRDRARRAIAAGDPDFLIHGVPVVPVGGLPTDRRLPVTAVATEDDDWESFRIEVNDQPTATTTELGSIGVDWARFVFADADAIGGWIHDDAIDGLADIVFWGRDEDEVAAEFGATRTTTPGDEVYGWTDLPIAEAYEKAMALSQRRESEPERKFAFDFRPHSHHYQVMGAVRASEEEAATIDVGGVPILFAMTSVGDGFFPVHLEWAADGSLVGIRVTVQE